MLETIESTHLLKKRLGHHLQLIETLDPLPQERRRTKKWRATLIDKYGMSCGYCRRSTSVDTAHLIPLEIGGTTVFENLLLLCNKCHGLFDSGCVSIHAMSEVAGEWRRGTVPGSPRPPLDDVRPSAPTFTEPPGSLQGVLGKVSGFQTQRKYRKAIDLIDQYSANSLLADSERYYLLIKRAELTRRRSARGLLDEALRSLEGIERDRLPKNYWPYFYYEYGYIRQLQGSHAEAAGLMHRSAEVSQQVEQSGKTALGYIAGSANEILCQVSMLDSLTEMDAKEFESRLDDLQKGATEHGQYWGGRWALNCAANRLRIRLKKRDENGSWKALRALRDLYYRSDLRSGWDSAARQSMSLLEGLTRVFFPRDDFDIDRSIRLLSRSFVTRLGPRQRPEGIRDVGLGLVEGLRRKGSVRMAQTCVVLEGLMSRTMDGTSVLWPWRASAEHGREPCENRS